ncbi:MAG: hypothetical protein AABW46_03240 [Nanoarchaeota archaeon]|mgnify:CR=1 FL=1
MSEKKSRAKPKRHEDRVREIVDLFEAGKDRIPTIAEKLEISPYTVVSSLPPGYGTETRDSIKYIVKKDR